MQFADDETIPSGHRMTFKESLRIVSLNVFQRLVFPMGHVFHFETTEHLDRIR